MKKLTEYSSLP